MKRFFLFLIAVMLLACNNSGTVTGHSDLDRTDNDDTANKIPDSLTTTDSIQGR